MSDGNEHAKRQRTEGGGGVAAQHAMLAAMQKYAEYKQKWQKYDEVVAANQKWKYSAPMPSPPYWVSLEDEEMIDGAWEFLEQIEKSTRALRRPSVANDINIRIDMSTDDFAGALPYHEALLPHWKEFASALEQQRHVLKVLPDGKKTKLLLRGVELPDIVVDLLSNALHSTHFRAFGLSSNNLSRKGIDFVLEYAQNNPILEGFGLGCSSASEFDENDMEKLCEIVKHHPSMKTLTLTEIGGNCVDSDAFFQTIMTAAARKVAFLSLKDNSISTGGEPFISDFLRHTNSVLKRLDLAWNYLNDADAVMIADALQENTTLRSLTLEGNLIGKEGWTALYKATFDGTSLRTAEDSNHTCYIEYPTSDDDIDLGQELLALSKLNGDSSAIDFFCKKSVRQAKIYSVLSLNNRNYGNAQNMGDVPVELLPDLLSTIQKYSNYHSQGKDFSPRQDRKDVRPLSIVYEMMRTWEKVFPVYESLRIRSLNEATGSYYGTCKDNASYADVSLHYDFNQSYYRNCSYRYLTNRLRSAPTAGTV